ncbi:MAG: hypothetical protein AB8B53_07435 [Flavobacteriales bacterium]
MTKTIYAISLALMVLLIFSCRKDQFNTSSNFKVEFSRDTILFDTVFTTVGSATQVFKVYNPDKNNSVELDYISLENSTDSRFRINVNGEVGPTVRDIEIAPEDSIFVFVETTLDANDQSLPFIIEENLLVNANGTDQEVVLAAWGQNAIFHGGIGGFDVICDETWTNELPHVIYGIVAVDSACCLSIQPGTQIHVHSGSGLYVYKGCIESNGQLGNEVVFQGDRLEFSFEDVPGQWGIEIDFAVDFGVGPEIVTVTRGGIWLSQPEASYMDHTIIKNGVIGLQVDTTGAVGEDALQLRNCQIFNHSAIGLLGQGTTISGFNNLMANCGQSTGVFQFGGEYKFDHCTFANYWDEGTRQAPSFIMSNNYEANVDGVDIDVIRSLGNSRFRNCAFYGDNASLSDYSEFIVDLLEPENEFFTFENCLVDTELDISDASKYQNIINQQDASFVNPSLIDFRPTSNSPLVGQATPLGGALGFDLLGVSRFGGSNPDIGCLESPE